MQSIVQFVPDSVDEASEGFIPKEDRIAVFDFDGTLYGERFPTSFNLWFNGWRALHCEDYDAPERATSSPCSHSSDTSMKMVTASTSAAEATATRLAS